jgi:predicted transposase
MDPGMRRSRALRLFQGVHARLVFLLEEDERAALDLTRRFSSATRYVCSRVPEGQDRKELKRESQGQTHRHLEVYP